MQQLILAQALDRLHQSLSRQASAGGGKPPLMRWVQSAQPGDPTPDDCLLQESPRLFDLGKFGHRMMMMYSAHLRQRRDRLSLAASARFPAAPGQMASRPRSLKHEYELYVESEIEDYKESVSRGVLLSIGDEAVGTLSAQPQFALTELLLCEEVDRIIRRRIRLPSYATWRRRRVQALRELSRPERWGLRPDSALARTMTGAREGHVLVAGSQEEGPALYLAANGCAVTALHHTDDVLDRVMDAAAEVGLTGRVRAIVGELCDFAPDIPLDAFVCAATALAQLTPAQRAHVLRLLQEATTAGGMHVLATGDGKSSIGIEELEERYRGWETSVERDHRASETLFLARKGAA
jgi:hypothetical protein